MVRKYLRLKICRLCQVSLLIVFLQAVIYYGLLGQSRLHKTGPRTDSVDLVHFSESPSGETQATHSQGKAPRVDARPRVNWVPGLKRPGRTEPLGPYEGPNLYYGKYSVKYQLDAKKLEVEGANPHEFKYYMKPEGICDDKEVFLLLVVHSRPGSFKNRDLIRKTWGNPNDFLRNGSRSSVVKTVFVLGVSLNDSIDAKLDEENAKYHDLIQENFIDHYRNMTYKHMASFKWVSQNCNNSKYVLKADDDIMTDIFTIIRYLQHIPQGEKEQNFIMGAITTPAVYRQKGTQWYVSQQEYRDNRYQTYPMGFAYVTTTRAVTRMFTASLTTPFYWIDDVYIGILAAKIGGVNFKRVNGKMSLWLRDNIDKLFLKNGYYFAHLQSPGLHFMLPIFEQLLKREHLTKRKITK